MFLHVLARLGRAVIAPKIFDLTFQQPVSVLQFYGISHPIMSKKRQADTELADGFENRIKDVRRRPRGTTPTSGSGAPQAPQAPNAFSSMSSAPNPAFQSSSFTMPSTSPSGFKPSGFNFGQGQSQSFPGASSGPSQPAQTGSTPFAFGNTGQAGFNFSSGFNNPSSNPFSFGSGNSGPSQPAPQSGFIFNNGLGNQSTSQTPAFSFGAQPTPNTSTGGGLFGQPAPAAPAPAPAAPAADSMQISPAKPKGPSAQGPSDFPSRDIFGGSGTSNIFKPQPAAAASNPFGGLNATPAAEKPASDKADAFAAAPALAGQASSTPASSQPFGSLFGAAPATSQVGAPQNVSAAPLTTAPAQPFGGLFGAKPVASTEAEKVNVSQPATGNIFAAQPAAGQTSLFAPKPATEPAAPKPSGAQNPFGNLFGAKPAGEQAPPSNLFAAKPAASEEAEKAKPAPAVSSGSFAAQTPAATSAAPEKLPAAPIGNMFAPKTTASTSTSQSEVKEPAPNPFGNLFTPKPPAAPATALNSQTESPKPSSSFGNMFAPKPSAVPSTTPGSAPTGSQGPLSSSSGASKAPLFAPQPPAAPPVLPNTSQGGNQKFGQATASALSASGTSTTTAPTTAGTRPLPEEDLSGSAQGAAKRARLSEPSSTSAPALAISPDVPAEVREQAELMFKVRSLNHFFRAEVLKYDAENEELDNLILFYIKARAALGHPVKHREDAKADQETATTGGDSVRESATAALFAKSFAASKSSQNAPELAPTTTTKESENTPKTIPATTTTPAGAVANGTSKTPANTTGPSLGGNMFAKSASNAQNSASLAGNMFAKSASASQGSTPSLAVPKFGNGGSGVDFMAQFKAKADKTAAEEKAKRKAEDFDSEEDDEEEWERRDAEKQRQKRAKLEGAKKKAVWVEGEGFKFVDAEESTEEPAGLKALPAPESSRVQSASPAASSGSIFDSSSKPLANSENIFGSLSAKTGSQDAHEAASEDEEEWHQSHHPKRRLSRSLEGKQDGESAARPRKRSKSPEDAETTKSSLDTPLPAPTASAGRSLFDRIQSTTPQNESPAPAPAANPFAASLGKISLFGASNNTSGPGASPALFGQSAGLDHTWKPSSPIKFSTTSTAAPTGSSVLGSTTPSVAGGTDNAATSEDATGDGETAPGAIFDLSQGNAGEEEEKVVFECRARALKLGADSKWEAQGTGVARLLQHPNGRARVVLRAEPSGKVVLNTFLKKELEYAESNNAVQFMVPQADAPPQHWAIRMKAENSKNFHKTVEEIKN